MNKSIDTNSFNIIYNHKILDYENIINNKIILELYRSFLYNKLKTRLKKYYDIFCDYYKTKHTNIDINNKKYFVSFTLLLDIMSIFIIEHKFKSNLDPIFDLKSPFNKKNLNKYFKNRCIPSLDKKIRLIIIEVLPKISKIYKKYYNKIKKNIKKIDNIVYDIEYNINDKNVDIKLNINENNLLKIKNNNLSIPIHIFNHLVKLYNNNKLNNYISSEVIENDVVKYIYMIFIRYKMLSNGNNQSSLLPSFKKILKDKLNIKIELFGSPINTSTNNYGSIFYDIEKVFGSIGNIFSMKINKGYYELNPIFDKCLIDKLLIKCTNELIEAENNKNQLLFFFILPISYFKYSNIPSSMKNFIKFDKILQKKEFPYIRYNRDFTKTIVSPIVITKLIICHTSFINNYVKYNVSNFLNILEDWIK